MLTSVPLMQMYLTAQSIDRIQYACLVESSVTNSVFTAPATIMHCYNAA